MSYIGMDIGPAPPPPTGRIVGLRPALHFAGDVASPAIGLLLQHRQRIKEFNDAQGFNLAGSTRGKLIKTGGPSAPTGAGVP
jgi:hypothetical protein